MSLRNRQQVRLVASTFGSLLSGPSLGLLIPFLPLIRLMPLIPLSAPLRNLGCVREALLELVGT